MADFQANSRPFAELDRAGRTRRLRRLAEAALTAYAVPVARLTPLAHGHNTTFRVDGADGQRYVLRVQRPDGPGVAQVRAEMAWLTTLRRETGLVVPQPVPTRARDLVTVVADPAVPEPRTCVLCHWVEGRFVDERLTPPQLYAVGEFTARLHLHGARMNGLDRGRVDDLTEFGRTQVDGFSAAVVERAVAAAGGDERIRRAVARVRAVRAELGCGADVFGLVHGDLHQDNYLLHRGRVHVIDFDDCGYGHFAYDLAVASAALAHLPQRHELQEALLDGYRSVRPDAATTDPQVLAAFAALRRVQLRLRRPDASQ